jgi:DNA-binding transcriptional regulator YhcF (GntR family)
LDAILYKNGKTCAGAALTDIDITKVAWQGSWLRAVANQWFSTGPETLSNTGKYRSPKTLEKSSRNRWTPFSIKALWPVNKAWNNFIDWYYGGYIMGSHFAAHALPFDPPEPMETRWSALMPDARNVTPLYLQLARNLATAIHCGVWSAGEALPSERTLSDAIGVSRITARKAIELLVEQGLIRRARGAGSFITPRVEDPLSRLTGFTKKMQQRGFRPDSVWLERGIRAANRDELVHLGLSPGAAVTSLRRLRRADGIVMAVEHSAL